MSDEEETSSVEEAFSASEDEWKPPKGTSGRHKDDGESSDDDDSDFEGTSPVGATTKIKKKREPKKSISGISSTQSKKRKSSIPTLRTKLYNKYKPPPRTVPRSGQADPYTVSSVKQSTKSKVKDSAGSDSDSSVDHYLVDPNELDLRSSFFDVGAAESKSAASTSKTSPVPQFDCNAGMNLSDSEENDDDDDDDDEEDDDDDDEDVDEAKSRKTFDFKNLLDNATNLEQAKENYAKRHEVNAAANNKVNASAGDQSREVQSLLAIGETNAAVAAESTVDNKKKDPLPTSKSSNTKRQTKFTKSARQQKTQSKIAVESEDSDWEEVADECRRNDDKESQLSNATTKDLQICVELPQTNKHNHRRDQKQIDIEATLKRQLNRDIKEKQFNLHKASLLVCFARSMYYNKLINNTSLMEVALKLLPSKNSYPKDRTEIKYFSSLVTWYKTAVALNSDQMYIIEPSTRIKVIESLLEQIKKRQALSKQSFILIFIILVRAMGLQCRLVVNLVPLPMRPASTDLCSIKSTKSTDNKSKQTIEKSKSISLESSEKKEIDKKSKVSHRKSHQNKNKPKSDVKKIKNPKNSKPKSTNSPEMVQSDDNKPSCSSVKLSSKLKEKITSRVEKRKVLDTDDNPMYKNRMYKPQQQTQKTTKSFEEALYSEPDRSQAAITENQQSELSKSSKSQSAKLTKKSNLDNNNKLTNNTSLTKQNANPNPNLTSPIARRTRLRSHTQPHTSSSEMNKNLTYDVNPSIKITKVAKKKPPPRKTSCEIVRRSRSNSPKFHISPQFVQSKLFEEKFKENTQKDDRKRSKKADTNSKVHISPSFLQSKSDDDQSCKPKLRKLRSTASKNTLTIPQFDGVDDSAIKSRPRLKKLRKPSSSSSLPADNTVNEDISSDDFEQSPPKKPKISKPTLKVIEQIKKDRRVLSTDDENEGNTNIKQKNSVNMWPEVWSDSEEKWICIDLFKGKVHCIDIIKKSANNSSGFAYVFAFQNDEKIKDVSARYCSNWCTTMRKGRVEQDWLDEALHRYYSKKKTHRDILEDQELRRIHEEKPLPTTISEYKNHPLYVLRRHLLKFEEIYPENPQTLGFIRGEPVYARECVHTLHSREIWLKQARVVKLGEKPYKIVKARPKWDRLTRQVITDQPLEIFGYWQTQDYEPPTAENGIVPRNAYGNVELFKKCMLPKKTVHIQLPGLSRICKKLGIDCAPAVNGFDFHSGACHPTYDGFVVCEEFGDQVVAAWYQDQEESERKEQEKYEARVYGNWKKLIRGLLIRERLKRKYNF